MAGGILPGEFDGPQNRVGRAIFNSGSISTTLV
jgi:hypothetical protein